MYQDATCEVCGTRFKWGREAAPMGGFRGKKVCLGCIGKEVGEEKFRLLMNKFDTLGRKGIPEIQGKRWWFPRKGDKTVLEILVDDCQYLLEG